MLLGTTGDAISTLYKAQSLSNFDPTRNTSLDLIRGIGEYRFRGKAGLRQYVSQSWLVESPLSARLINAAECMLMLDDKVVASKLVSRAMAAVDYTEANLSDPWYFRQGSSDALTVGAVMLRSEDSASGLRTLSALREKVQDLIDKGLERAATYELLAEIVGEMGDAAIRALRHAVDLGWRDEWWLTHSPHLASIRSRSELLRLVTEIQGTKKATASTTGP
jgi:hypothetical protein